MTSASDQPCEFVNHYSVSFGLDNRYDDPYCNNVLWSLIALQSIIALRYINGVTPPKLQALARRDTPALTQ